MTSDDLLTPPAEAATVFGTRLALAGRYATLLATTGVERGLIGPREAPRLWERHLLNCAAISSAVPRGARLADLGSGAGLPGVVLAILRPDVATTLVEPLLRRATFLSEVLTELGLDSVEVVRARAEELASASGTGSGGRVFDVVTARALAPMSRLAGWALPLVAPGGELVAMKGASAANEVLEARATIRRLGGEPARVQTLTAPGGSSTATVVRVARRPAR